MKALITNGRRSTKSIRFSGKYFSSMFKSGKRFKGRAITAKRGYTGNAELDKKTEKPNKKEHDQNFFSCNDGLSATKINERN